MTVTAADISIVDTAADGLSALVKCSDAACGSCICADTVGAVHCIDQITAGCTYHTACVSMSCTYLFCIAGKLRAVTFCSKRALIDTDDTTDFFITSYRHAGAYCGQFSFGIRCTIDQDRTTSFIKADYTADTGSIITADRSCHRILTFILNLDTSAVTSCHTAHIIASAGDICQTAVLFQGSVQHIPCNNTAQRMFTRDSFILCSAAVLDRTCIIGYFFITPLCIIIASDIDRRNTTQIAQSRITKVVIETAVIDQSAVQSDDTADTGESGHGSRIGAVIYHLIFQIDTDDTAHKMQLDLLCVRRKVISSNFLTVNKVCQFYIVCVSKDQGQTSLVPAVLDDQSTVFFTVANDTACVETCLDRDVVGRCVKRLFIIFCCDSQFLFIRGFYCNSRNQILVQSRQDPVTVTVLLTVCFQRFPDGSI